MFFPIYIYKDRQIWFTTPQKSHRPRRRLKAWTKLRRPVGTVGTEAGETDVFDGHLPGDADGPTGVSVGNRGKHGNHFGL